MNESPINAETLKARWNEGEWFSQLKAIRSHAEKHSYVLDTAFLRSLGLPEHDGRLDMRGVPLFIPWDPPRWNLDKTGVRLHDDALTSADFSDAHLHRTYFIGTSISDCLFRRAQLEECCWNTAHIRSCDFSGSRLTWLCVEDRSSISDCFFDGSKMRHSSVICGHSIIHHCSFRSIDWRTLELNACEFRECVFSGKLEKSQLRPPIRSRLTKVFEVFRTRGGASTVFDGCDFTELAVKQFSVYEGAMLLLECSGFPTYKTPDTEWVNSYSYHSEGHKTEHNQ